MKVTKTLITFLISGLVFVSAGGTVSAIQCPDGSFLPDEQAADCPPASPTTAPPPSSSIDADCNSDGGSLTRENCTIVDYLVIGINILSGIAGIAIVASIMMAGYQYMTARDNAGQIQAARTRIVWAIVALLIFIFMYSFLNFLVPGGVLP